MFFERCCPVCRRPAAAVCARCWERLESAPVRWLASPSPGTGLDLEVRSLFAYSDAVATMILAAKNGGRRQVFRQLGRAMTTTLDGIGVIDCVTWIPAATANRRVRGFDQGRLLARCVAAHLGVPARSFLARSSTPAGTSQKGKGRDDRLLGSALLATRPAAGNVLLVDDVVTTGASLRHGADALFGAGATRVVAVTAASVDHRTQSTPEVTFGLLRREVEPA